MLTITSPPLKGAGEMLQTDKLNQKNSKNYDKI